MSFSTEMQGRVQRLLDSIPGYRGYRNIDDRRVSDRQLRERIASMLESYANSVEQIGRQLADQRRLGEIAPVEQLAQRLRFLVNRVRAQPEGYAALFSGRVVDEAVVDQLALFDSGLLTRVEQLQPKIDALADDSELPQAARNAIQDVETVLKLLDSRSNVLTTASKVEEPSILEFLEPPQDSGNDELRQLEPGDALSIEGKNYLTDAVIKGSLGESELSLVRLEQSTGKWLLTRAPELTRPVLIESGAEIDKTGQSVDIDGTAFTLSASSTGSAELTGPAGKSPKRSIQFGLYRSGSNSDRVVVILDWGTETISGVGTEIDARDIEVFGKPKQ
jgi:hypothetical protein